MVNGSLFWALNSQIHLHFVEKKNLRFLSFAVHCDDAQLGYILNQLQSKIWLSALAITYAIIPCCIKGVALCIIYRNESHSYPYNKNRKATAFIEKQSIIRHNK